MMKACATAGGGVMFIPDEPGEDNVQRPVRPLRYGDIAGEAAAPRKPVYMRKHDDAPQEETATSSSHRHVA